MTLFDPDNHQRSDRHKRIYAYTEVAYTTVDFLAALLFVIGSILFFSQSTTEIGTWLFLIGSILFGMRPTIKLFREIAYLRIGDLEDAANPPSVAWGTTARSGTDKRT
ncbi:YrhK family protein [Granulosicoccus sp. 3-233]|uniref:YrhK family protein n=1 Tax=Granulosicoccus sp. 3-233 TaxID=3417969 RepID=UPI003D352381